MELGLRALAAAIAVLTGIGAGVSTGLATGKAVESVSRQPEASSKIITSGCRANIAAIVIRLR